MINIDRDSVRLEIERLLGVGDIYLELLLDRLDIKDNDIINILDIDKNGNVYFNVNNDRDYCIRIRNNNDDRYPLVYFERDNLEYGYQCIYREVKDYVSLSMNMFRYDYDMYKNIVSYEVGEDFVEYRVCVLDKILEFRLSKPYKYINRNGYYVNYEVPHHKGIVNYLSKLDDINSILDIYNDLCVLKIGNDIYKYDNIDLRIMNRDEDGNINVVELIQLDEGNLSSLIVNRNGYDILFNNGRWVYDNSRLQVMYEYCKNNGIVSLNTRVNVLCDNDEYNDDMISRDIISADNEIDGVKKLVRKIINNRDGN